MISESLPFPTDEDQKGQNKRFQWYTDPYQILLLLTNHSLPAKSKKWTQIWDRMRSVNSTKYQGTQSLIGKGTLMSANREHNVVPEIFEGFHRTKRTIQKKIVPFVKSAFAISRSSRTICHLKRLFLRVPCCPKG